MEIFFVSPAYIWNFLQPCLIYLLQTFCYFCVWILKLCIFSGSYRTWQVGCGKLDFPVGGGAVKFVVLPLLTAIGLISWAYSLFTKELSLTITLGGAHKELATKWGKCMGLALGVLGCPQIRCVCGGGRSGWGGILVQCSPTSLWAGFLLES